MKAVNPNNIAASHGFTGALTKDRFRTRGRKPKIEESFVEGTRIDETFGPNLDGEEVALPILGMKLEQNRVFVALLRLPFSHVLIAR